MFTAFPQTAQLTERGTISKSKKGKVKKSIPSSKYHYTTKYNNLKAANQQLWGH